MSDSAIVTAIRRWLTPLVRTLLRQGIGVAQFVELAKQTFVAAARSDYGLQGRPTNNARVALLTGLSRREVARLRDELAGAKPQREPTASRFSAVLGGWHLDPEFRDANGGPAELPEHGPHPSLESLLKRYAGDHPHGAVLKEMLRLGLVAAGPHGFRPRARSYVRSPADPDIVRQAGQALYDHGTTVAHNVDAERRGAPRFERMASVQRLPRRELEAFQAFVESEGQAFLETVDAWLASRAIDADHEETDTVRAGVGVYLIQDERS